MNREQWMNKIAAAVQPAFKKAGGEYPAKWRAACGYPSTGGKSKRIGECHYAEGSSDGHVEIFIRPDLDDAMEVGGVLIHELVHACLGPGFKHGKEFKALATAMGLEGKMTATTVGPVAREHLEKAIAKVGPYPHGALMSGGGQKKPSTADKWVNVRCPEDDFFAKQLAADIEAGDRLKCPHCRTMLMTKAERAEYEGD